MFFFSFSNVLYESGAPARSLGGVMPRWVQNVVKARLTGNAHEETLQTIQISTKILVKWLRTQIIKFLNSNNEAVSYAVRFLASGFGLFSDLVRKSRQSS